jgi:hypothetical protein
MGMGVDEERHKMKDSRFKMKDPGTKIMVVSCDLSAGLVF